MMEAKPRCSWMLLLTAIMFLGGWWSPSTTSACWEDERIALLNLKPYFSYYNDLNSWVETRDNSNSSNCCNWECVVCNSTTRRVESLALYAKRNIGEVHLRDFYLNVSLFLPFQELKSLYLSRNGIAGFVKNEETQAVKLSNLEELDLSYNSLRNDTLAFLHTFSRLKFLDISANQLEGSIDIKGLNNLINLRRLDLSYNKIESLKPSQGSRSHLRLTYLEELNLGENLFNNSVFASLNKLSNLKNLDISANKLEGSIDTMKDLGGFTNLEELDMSGNTELNKFVAHRENRSLTKLKLLSLDGVFTNGSIIDLVELLKAFSYVKIFSLKHNHFSGTFPIQDREMYRVNNVEGIILDDSYLDANIFETLGVFTSLKFLSLSNCQGIGTLTNKGWCNLRNLRVLDLSGNALEGMLPLCFGNLTSLRYLSLSKNHLQVPISFSPLTNLSNLKVLSIDENKLVMDPYAGFHTSLPKFQLNIISLVKCMTDQKLMREAPRLLYYQHDLRVVDLSYNNISGSIPVWLLENNTDLESLFLVGNSFTGSLLLPPLPHLSISSIDMSHNKIQGQIPTNTCSAFPYLENLFLSQNEFKGDIPPCLGGMRVLTYLDLSDNQLSGEIPEELMKSGSLKRLRLSNNKLGGKIVPTIFTSSILVYLYLNGNNFVGEIPDIDKPSSLVVINLSNNSLSGELPAWIWNLSNLRVLDLSNNHFEGSIPIEVCNLERLEILDFSHNILSGSIPSCFSHPSIRLVHLNGNKLNGPVTLAFPNSPELVTLDLGGNNLISGNITEWIGGLSVLGVLILRDNHLDGVIPAQLCKLHELSILDLSKNMLSGPIPTCMGNLALPPRYQKSASESIHMFETTREDISTFIGRITSAYDFDAFRKFFTGYQMESFYYHSSSSNMEEWVDFKTKNNSYSYKGDILEYMSGIDLSCNKLTGHIPFELGNLSGIHALNLSHNNLIGGIPSSFSKLKEIESLDLSYNNLSGRIPNQLVELNSLAVFTVAHNNLSGNTPERKAQFGTFDESSYEGNPFLCGPPLHNSCSPTGSQSTTSNVDEEGGLLDTYVFCITFLVTYVVVLLVIFIVLYINPYWRRRWFLFIENFIDSCRYSSVGNFLALHIFRINAWSWRCH